MTQTDTTKDKKNIVAEEVLQILTQKGQSKIFNFQDFKYYKRQAKKAFNQSQTIAEFFLNDYSSTNKSDFSNYQF